MEEILGFLDSCSIDREHYIRVNNRDAVTYELWWAADKSPRKWKLNPLQEPNENYLNAKELKLATERVGIDSEELAYKLRSVALAQLSFAMMTMREAEKRLGPGIIREAESWLESLQSELVKHVTQLLENNKQTSTEQKPHLALVRDPT